MIKKELLLPLANSGTKETFRPLIKIPYIFFSPKGTMDQADTQ
jgi:hypothetical protein